MKRPSLQWYPGDWRSNANLRRCSPAARGVWMDVIGLLHDSEQEYGALRWPLKEIAQAAGAAMAHIKELVDKRVLKGADKDAEPYVYTPRHAGKNGAPVTLIEANGGPLWYSSRMVRDEWVRARRGQSTRFDEENQPTKGGKKGAPKSPPNPTFGDESGDGPSSSSSTSKRNTEDSHDAGACAPNLGEFQPTQAGVICRALKACGISDPNPGHAGFLALIAAGASLPEFEGAARQAVKGGKGFAYAIGTLTRQRAEAAEALKTMPRGAMPEAGKTTFQASREAEANAWMGSLAPAMRGQQHNDPNTIDMEPSNGPRLAAR